MLVVETIAKIRRAFFVEEKPIKVICRELRVSRKVVRKVIRSAATAFRYERGTQPLPKIGPWREQLDAALLANELKTPRERLTLIRVFEDLRRLGYEGSYDAVRRYAKAWRRERGAAMAEAYVPLSFAPGEAYQFDWSHEIVVLNGVTATVKVAHVRLCHSRMLFVRAYPRETQEMVFDAHDRAFAFFKGTCVRGIYDNMKTAVETVFVGKDRRFNRRFLQMCSHYLIEPTACTPASGWEKGQVENQVGLVRERFFTPRLRVTSYTAARPLRRLRQGAQASRDRRSDDLAGVRGGACAPSADCRAVRWLPRRHCRGLEDLPRSLRQQQVLGVLARRRPAGRGPGLCRSHRHPAGRGDRWRARSLLRPRPMPLHYVPVLARKPGALRNGAPFKDWLLPANLERVRRKLRGSNDGDRHMVAILSAVLTDGLAGVEAACAEALADGVHSAAVILNILARQRDPGPAVTILTPAALRLRHAPVADCARYDRLRRVS
jgi:transposase